MPALEPSPPPASERFNPPGGLVLERRTEDALDEVVLSFPLPSDDARHPKLSPAERAVLGEVARGFSNAEIARRRGVSPRTIANQLAQLFRKLGVHSRFEALRVAGHRAGLVFDGRRSGDPG